MGGNAVCTQHDLFNLRGVGQHGQHHVAGLADFRVGGGLGPGGYDLVHAGLVQIADREVIARLEQVLRHGLAHNTKTDQSDFHNTFPP